jgi:hypothetical protein
MVDILGKTYNGRRTNGVVQYSTMAEEAGVTASTQEGQSYSFAGKWWNIGQGNGSRNGSSSANTSYGENYYIYGGVYSSYSDTGGSAGCSVDVAYDLRNAKRFFISGCGAASVTSTGWPRSSNFYGYLIYNNTSMMISSAGVTHNSTVKSINGNWWIYIEINGNQLTYWCGTGNSTTGIGPAQAYYTTGTITLTDYRVSVGASCDTNHGGGANFYIIPGFIEYRDSEV